MAASVKNTLEDTQPLEVRRDLVLSRARLVCINPHVLGEGSSDGDVALDNSVFRVGRDRDNELVVIASGVSRSHARLVFDGTHWSLEDTGSANGVMVNKSRCEKKVLCAGDIVSIGSVHFKFHLDEKAGKSKANHQVSLFDTESTLVLSRKEVQGEGSAESEPVAHQPKRKPRPKSKPNREVPMGDTPGTVRSPLPMVGALAALAVIWVAVYWFV